MFIFCWFWLFKIQNEHLLVEHMKHAARSLRSPSPFLRNCDMQYEATWSHFFSYIMWYEFHIKPVNYGQLQLTFDFKETYRDQDKLGYSEQRILGTFPPHTHISHNLYLTYLKHKRGSNMLMVLLRSLASPSREMHSHIRALCQIQRICKCQIP